jgi:hypothetical protein
MLVITLERNPGFVADDLDRAVVTCEQAVESTPADHNNYIRIYQVSYGRLRPPILMSYPELDRIADIVESWIISFLKVLHFINIHLLMITFT